MKRKGFTLIELILSLVIFSWILLVFATLVSFNYRFSSMTQRTDSIIQDYLAYNTYLYNQGIKSKKVELLDGNKVRLTIDEYDSDTNTFNTVYDVIQIKNRKLYYNTDALYKVKAGSYIDRENNDLVIRLNIDTPLEQSVDIVIPDKLE